MRLCFAFFLALSAAAQIPSIQWTRQFGTSPIYDEARSAATGAGPAQEVYVAGYTFGSLAGFTNAGSYDAFVRKYDANGNELWSRQFGTSESDVGLGVATDSTGVYVVGYTWGVLPGQAKVASSSDAFVRKYDSQGNEVWTRQFGASSGTGAEAITVNAAGIWVAGWTNGVFPGEAGAGSTDAFVRMYDHNGNHLWTRQFGGTNGSSQDYASGLAHDATGIYVSGYMTNSGALPGQVSAGATDAFVRKYDFTGNLLWTHQFGSAGDDLAFGIAAGITGVIVAGRTSSTLPGQVSMGSWDAFARKFDAAGNILWTRQFGSSQLDLSTAVAVSSENVYLSGITYGSIEGQSGYSFVRKYDAAGVSLWTLQFGTSGSNNAAYGLSTHNAGVYVAGTAPANAGDRDANLVRIVDTSNQPPSIAVAFASLVLNEGSAAANNGTFSDANASDNISISASFGTIAKAGLNSGTWTWSWNAIDGPAPSQNVIVTAEDGQGGVATSSFTVTVLNVAPSVSFSMPPALSENQTAALSGLIADPGALDSHGVTITWGDGSSSNLSLPAGVLNFAATHTYTDDNPSGTSTDTYQVTVAVIDKDNGSAAASALVTVNNTPPVIEMPTGPASPAPLGASITVSARVSDAGPNDTLICSFSWGDGSPDSSLAPTGGVC